MLSFVCGTAHTTFKICQYLILYYVILKHKHTHMVAYSAAGQRCEGYTPRSSKNYKDKTTGRPISRFEWSNPHLFRPKSTTEGPEQRPRYYQSSNGFIYSTRDWAPVTSYEDYTLDQQAIQDMLQAQYLAQEAQEAQEAQAARDQVRGGSRRSRTRRATGSRKKSSRSIRRRRRAN